MKSLPTQRDSAHSQEHEYAGADTGDLNLVRRAQSGEGRAFDQLMLKYRARVMKLAMRYTRNRADAEDFAQETFTKALVGLRHFRCECAFYTWLYRIATNSAKTTWSARARDPIDRTSDPQYDPAAADYPSQLQELETPEELAFADDLGGVVNATLEALPEELRTAIMLREIDSLTYEEIAVAMAIKVGTVRSRVFRARDEIDQQLRRLCASGLGRDGWRRSGPLLQLPTSPDAFSRSARHS